MSYYIFIADYRSTIDAIVKMHIYASLFLHGWYHETLEVIIAVQAIPDKSIYVTEKFTRDLMKI